MQPDNTAVIIERVRAIRAEAAWRRERILARAEEASVMVTTVRAKRLEIDARILEAATLLADLRAERLRGAIRAAGD